MVIFGASAMWALVWAVRNGVMHNFRAGAYSLFDADEPVGRPTDSLPNERS
jgi:hypothetical protein